MKGYKVFHQDFTCHGGFKFEVGETYTHKGKIKLCKSGFHFCEEPADCFNYYSFDPNNIVCEVEAEDVSNKKEDDSKRVCGKITIVRQLNWYEVLNIVNIGKDNTGLKNSGNRNSGSYNSGSYNSGSYNSGDFNSGSYNSGDFNSGNYNSGSHHSGSCNSRDCPMIFFNVVLDISVKEFNTKYYLPIEPKLMYIKDNVLKQRDHKEAWKLAWQQADVYTQQKLLNMLESFKIPKENFEEVTGIILNN